MLLSNEFEDPCLNNTDDTKDIDHDIETLRELIEKCNKELSSLESEN